MGNTLGSLLGGKSLNDNQINSNGFKSFDNFLVKQDLYDRYGKVEEISGQILKDIELFTNLFDDVNKDETVINQITNLEHYRIFPEGHLQGRGIFYCKSKEWLLSKYPYLRASSMFMYSNDVLTDRYIIPITLINGKDVFTFMGYHAPSPNETVEVAPYEVPDVPWVNQDYILGNLNSLQNYKYNPYKIILVGEGFTDAWRAESIFMLPAINLFGSNLTKKKKSQLLLLKQLGYKLFYIYDRDKAGKNDWLLHNDIWDNLVTFPEEKDMDNYISGWIYNNCQDENKVVQVPRDRSYLKNLIPHIKLHKNVLEFGGNNFINWVKEVENYYQI